MTVGSGFGAGRVARQRGSAASRERRGASGSGGGGWRLSGVEVEDELQALDFVYNG